MTAGFSAGNDLADNYELPRRRTAEMAASPGFLERMLAPRDVLLEHSNLVRVVKYHWGPALKSLLVPRIDEVKLTEALQLTQEALEDLDMMSRDYDFSLTLYLIDPLQAIRRDFHSKTIAELNAIAPAPIQPTAHLFSDDPQSFFFVVLLAFSLDSDSYSAWFMSQCYCRACLVSVLSSRAFAQARLVLDVLRVDFNIRSLFFIENRYSDRRCVNSSPFVCFGNTLPTMNSAFIFE